MDKNNKKILSYLVDFEDGDTPIITANAFVDQPATEVEMEFFNKTINFASDDNKQMISAPLMIANTPILRYHPNMGYYNVVFTETSIKKMVVDLFKNGNENVLKYNHEGEHYVGGINFVEGYFLGNNVKNDKFKDLPSGTYIVTYYVPDLETYNSIKSSGEFKGLSIEMAMDRLILKEMDFEQIKVNKILDIINSDDTDENKFKKIQNIL